MSPPPPCWSGYPWSIWCSRRRSSSLGGRSGEFLRPLSWRRWSSTVLTSQCSTDWDLTSWFGSDEACGWFGLHLAGEYHELASPATAFVFLPYFFCLSLPLSLYQEACGPRICDPVHITLLCLSHRQLWGTTCCGLFANCFYLFYYTSSFVLCDHEHWPLYLWQESFCNCRSFVVILDDCFLSSKEVAWNLKRKYLLQLYIWDQNDINLCRWDDQCEWTKGDDF